MRRVSRRLVTVLAAAVLWAAAGSAWLTASAFAGGVDTDGGILSAAVYNSTPYTWTLVTAQAPVKCYGLDCWATVPAQTIAPGGASLFKLAANVNQGPVIGNLWSTQIGYDGYFTYRVDVVGGAPEYITVGISQCHCTGVYGNTEASLQVWNTVAAPPAGYDPASLLPPGPQTAAPQLATRLNTPTLFDPNISAVGNFTVDASTDQGKPFVDLLNSACAGADNTSCSFQQGAAITYGPGALTETGEFNSCVGGDGGSGDDKNWASVGYETSQSASLSAGGGVTSGVELDLFGAITAGASISLDAEHQWEDTVTVSRTSRIYLPANSRGFMWLSPTVGTITGTLVATIGSATFTATNFSETRSGVPGPTDPIKQPTPAFSVVTKTRAMTAAEKSQYCGDTTGSRRLTGRAAKGTPPSGLVPGRSVGRVALGDSQATVLRRLGWPTVRSFPLSPCQGMPACAAVRGVHGTFEYKRRKLSVVFGPDRRVTALIYGGTLTTSDGVGKDDSMARLRAKFPHLSCAKLAKRVDCSVQHGSGPQTVRTVFRLTDRLRGSATKWATDKVLMYVKGAGKVTA